MTLATLAAPLQPLGYEQLTGMTASTALTVPDGATIAVIQAETQNVRWRDDGTAPTAGVGMLQVAAADPLVYTGNLSRVRLIQATAGAIANVAYYA